MWSEGAGLQRLKVLIGLCGVLQLQDLDTLTILACYCICCLDM